VGTGGYVQDARLTWEVPSGGGHHIIKQSKKEAGVPRRRGFALGGALGIFRGDSCQKVKASLADTFISRLNLILT